MRTKTLLLSAAALAAGVVTSMAANVYSVNVVGYVNVTLANGYNLISNPLDTDGIDNVQTIMPTLPDGTQMLQWTPGVGFAPVIQYYAGLGWYDSGLNPATNNLPPGIGFFINNTSGSSTSVTFVGTVVQGTNNQSVVPGYNFLASIPPIASDLDTNGFPAQDGMQYSTFVGGGSYSAAIQYYGGLGWYDSGLVQQFPTPAVAQGFLIFNGNPTTYTWTSSFTVQ